MRILLLSIYVLLLNQWDVRDVNKSHPDKETYNGNKRLEKCKKGSTIVIKIIRSSTFYIFKIYIRLYFCFIFFRRISHIHEPFMEPCTYFHLANIFSLTFLQTFLNKFQQDRFSWYVRIQLETALKKYLFKSRGNHLYDI